MGPQINLESSTLFGGVADVPLQYVEIDQDSGCLNVADVHRALPIIWNI
jgi:hypothetical protein